MEKKPLSKVVGANLKREIRQSRYRTQENFAVEFGAETRTVNRWLNEGCATWIWQKKSPNF